MFIRETQKYVYSSFIASLKMQSPNCEEYCLSNLLFRVSSMRIELVEVKRYEVEIREKRQIESPFFYF